MDSVLSNPSIVTAAYLAKKKSKTGIKCIPFNEITVKSFDASSVDFCACSLLKRALLKRHLKILNGHMKMIQKEWCKIHMTVLRERLTLMEN